MLRSDDSVQGPGELQLNETRISVLICSELLSLLLSAGPSVDRVSDTWYPLFDPPRTYMTHVQGHTSYIDELQA